MQTKIILNKEGDNLEKERKKRRESHRETNDTNLECIQK